MTWPTELEDRKLYDSSAEIRAAVMEVADMGLRFAMRVKISPDLDTAKAAGGDFHDDLVRFFAQYDRRRTEKIENLDTQLTEAMIRSMRPTRTDPPARRPKR